LSTALRARLVAELYCLVMLVMYSLFTLLNMLTISSKCVLKQAIAPRRTASELDGGADRRS